MADRVTRSHGKIKPMHQRMYSKWNNATITRKDQTSRRWKSSTWSDIHQKPSGSRIHQLGLPCLLGPLLLSSWHCSHLQVFGRFVILGKACWFFFSFYLEVKGRLFELKWCDLCVRVCLGEEEKERERRKEQGIYRTCEGLFWWWMKMGGENGGKRALWFDHEGRKFGVRDDRVVEMLRRWKIRGSRLVYFEDRWLESYIPPRGLSRRQWRLCFR